LLEAAILLRATVPAHGFFGFFADDKRGGVVAFVAFMTVFAFH